MTLSLAAGDCMRNSADGGGGEKDLIRETGGFVASKDFPPLFWRGEIEAAE